MGGRAGRGRGCCAQGVIVGFIALEYSRRLDRHLRKAGEHDQNAASIRLHSSLLVAGFQSLSRLAGLSASPDGLVPDCHNIGTSWKPWVAQALLIGAIAKVNCKYEDNTTD